MKKTFIFGHKTPDTDSVTASIALSYLKNLLGEKTAPAILSNINNETKFALDYFHIPIPEYLNDVKLQIEDLNYRKNFFLYEHASIYDSYLKMSESNVTGIPVVNQQKKLIGMVTLKNIAHHLVNVEVNEMHTSYENILNVIQGEEVLKFDKEIHGDIVLAAYKSTTILETVPFSSNDILVVGDRHSVIEYAVNCGVKLIVLVGNATIKEKHLEIAKKNKVNIVRTKLNTFYTAKRINLCNYINTLIDQELPIYFNENDYVDDCIKIANKAKHSNYPIVNKKQVCLGLLRINEVFDANKKKVILVDHNEEDQSVQGLEEAEIIEIIDHHKIGNVNTKYPISFRNMPVGSTNTIIYYMYHEANLGIPSKIAGIMLSGILSDTLLFKSPTTTKKDQEAALDLAQIANVDYLKYGVEMFKHGSSFKDKTLEEVLYLDFKDFKTKEQKIGIGQVFSMNIEEFLMQKDEYVNLLNHNANRDNYKVLALFITDIISNGSYVLYNEDAKSILADSFQLKEIHQASYIKDCLSRKKQIIPNIIDTIEK